MGDELEDAMDWTADIVQSYCMTEELDAPALHLFSAGREVDVAILTCGSPAQALSAARALILVHQPTLVTFALQTSSVEIHPLRAHKDPLLREWVERRLAGKTAPVRELPGDYLFDLLLIVGESRSGARAGRAWRLGGSKGARTCTPYEPGDKLSLCGPVPLHPLFVQDEAERFGIDPAELRRKAQHYLAHNQFFEKIYESPRGSQADQEEER